MRKDICAVILLAGIILPAFASSDKMSIPQKEIKTNSSVSAAQEALSVDKKLQAFTQQMQQQMLDPEKMGARLFEAVDDNDVTQIKKLINLGANVNYVQGKISVLGLALQKCEKHKDTQSLDELLNSADLKYNREDIPCCLSVLIEQNNGALIDKMLTKLPVSADASCKQKITPLFAALENARWSAASVLVKHGASLKEVISPLGYSPLHVFLLVNQADGGAWTNEHRELLQLLLEKEPSLLTQSSIKNHISPLMLVSAYGYYGLILQWWEIVKREDLDKDAFLNARDRNGDNALFYAIAHLNGETLRMLLDIGVDPNISNNHGITPITAARRMGMWPDAEYMKKFIK